MQWFTLICKIKNSEIAVKVEYSRRLHHLRIKPYRMTNLTGFLCLGPLSEVVFHFIINWFLNTAHRRKRPLATGRNGREQRGRREQKAKKPMATWEDESYESQQKHTALKSGNMFPLPPCRAGDTTRIRCSKSRFCIFLNFFLWRTDC